MLFSEFIKSEKVDTATTDGKKVYINEEFLAP